MILKKGIIRLNFFAIVLLLFLTNSCKDSFVFNMENIKTEGNITPKIALPLINASMTLESLLPDDEDLNRYLIIDEDHFITIAFSEQVAEYSAEEYMNGAPLSGPELPYVEYSTDPQIINLNFNTILGDGELYFANPSFKLLITNYWDIPSRFRFTDFYYYEEENSEAIPLTGSVVDDWHDITGPSNFGDSIIYEIVMDTTTSNIDEMISALPHHLSFGADLETIPGDPYNLPPGSVNKLSVEVNIPLELSLSNILLTDTMDFSLDVNTDSTKINSLTINFAAQNGFPLGVNAQVYFVDENYTIIDSLFSERRLDLKPATVSNGIANQTVDTEESITITADRMDNILEAKYLIPHILFSTPDANTTQVKLYSTYEFGLDLSAMIDVEITL